MSLRPHLWLVALLASCATYQGTTTVFECPGGGGELKATFYSTEPATLTLERGGRTAFLTQQPAASGTRYEGGGDLFWEHQGEARVRSNYGAEQTCRKKG